MFRALARPLAFLAIALSATAVAARPAAAADFYDPPRTVPTSPGTVIRSETAPLFAQIPGVPDAWPGSAQRILYASQRQDGAPVAVSGVVIEPSVAWGGAGPRPTVVVGPGTYGQGDQCAGSRTEGVPVVVAAEPTPTLIADYEVVNQHLLLTLGIRVIVTDYIGKGTPGVHTYANRAEEANAMIDAARAGLNLLRLPMDSPVGFWGYSQGGGAAAAAAELVGTRAPELNLKGSYVGAPPADLRAVLRHIDGTAATGVIGYAVNGLIERYPELGPLIDAELNETGRRFLSAVAEQCFADTVLTFGFLRTSAFTESGKTFGELVESVPELAGAVDEQRIGRRVPTAPVLVHASRNDDAIPEAQIVQLHRDWCALGVPSVLSDDIATPPVLTGLIANHAIGMLTGLPTAVQFLVDRFNDAPLTGTCTME
ncbi:lipase family protein [Rhodococcus erythropolis]|uniref:lipase family protein n=1 Tax=Rhodococcus erythropolis TaxID=1833 RepID=UPI001BE6F93F|nr:lipase family protein [Rhodococcus erythropolis]MBT2265781.1 lipase [Rhodococcus erythropolis]